MTSGVELGEPWRTVLLAALQEFYCPVQPDDIRAYIAAFAPEALTLPGPGQVLASEASAWRSGRLGPIWVCPAFVNGDAVANQEYLTRSDWSIENRLLIQNKSRARHVWLIRVFCDQYLVAEERGSRDLAPIFSRIRYHGELAASDLPGGVFPDLSWEVGGVDGDLIEELREIAEDSHAALAASERPERRRLAQELERFDGYRRLFGDMPLD
jgi:hypothetical protein